MTLDLSALQRVHFVGIGGIGMSALARYLLARGYQVSGSDRHPGEQGAAVRALGARVETGHDPQYLQDAELVVVTSAAAEDNPEVAEARRRGLPVVKRAELLGAIATGGRCIAVAGSHGKTTTSALIGHLLTEAGLDPTILIGGISANLRSNARIGGSDLIVVEADEYDASFLHLSPAIAVVTNLEVDHPDIYDSLEAIERVFQQFASQVQDVLVLCSEDALTPKLGGHSAAGSITYGFQQGDWTVRDIRDALGETTFRVESAGTARDFTMQLAGRHNALNALAAIIATHQLGVPLDTIAAALPTFRGVARRFERKGEAGGVLVMDDYAVHPTEVRAMVDVFKTRTGRPLRLVFQPHTFSRTKTFLSEFADALAAADYVYLMDVYAARETDSLGISGADLFDLTQSRHQHVRYTPSGDDTVQAVVDDAQPGDLVVTMGAGDVTRLGPRILDGLAQR